MSGHSKWSTIKRKKGAVDAKRGKIFTKMARQIILAARSGGGDPAMNASLRLAVVNAKSVNMPNDNIKKAIQKGTGEGDVGVLEEVVYEAYAQGGTAIIVECVTDNKNRTLPEIRNILSKSGANLAEKGSVAYLFAKKGSFIFDSTKTSEDKIMDVSFEFDVDDIKESEDDNTIEVVCELETYEQLRDAFDKNEMEYLNAEIAMLPSVSIPIDDYEIAKKLVSIVEKLEDNDDVQNVYTNYDLSEEIYQKLEEEGLI